ncbi:hypothetical protein [Flavobacterium chungangensis]|uniref:Uncharacterized protein n=1 Tax=Flavobacterium chungangensis TaxID=2708132 RepID=A0ABV8ZMP1_9FLAO
MKKVIYVLLLAQSTFLMAQKTVVTTYGEKITVNTGTSNGVSAVGGDVQLGGTLIKPTKITTDATNTLEINSGGTLATPISAIKIVDGNQAKGKVLTSDGNGVATWQPSKLTVINGYVPQAAFAATPIMVGGNGGDQFVGYTGCTITLAPGKWRLEFGTWIQIGGSSNPTGKFSSIFFSTSSTNPNAKVPLANGITLNSIIIPDLYSDTVMDKYGTGSVFIDLSGASGNTTIYEWAYCYVGLPPNVKASPSTFSITSMNGYTGAYGPYTYIVATSVD